MTEIGIFSCFMSLLYRKSQRFRTAETARGHCADTGSAKPFGNDTHDAGFLPPP
jgi:hypothetical protein